MPPGCRSDDDDDDEDGGRFPQRGASWIGWVDYRDISTAMTIELFFISLVVLILLLIILLAVCWILRRIRSRNFTEMKLSMGGISAVLTIRTEQDHADQMMDRMLDRVFLQVKEDSGVEPRAEPEEELAEASGSDPEVSTASPLSRATPPPPPPVDQDQIDVLGDRQSNVSWHASLFSQGSSNSSYS
ncbi:hypothetical protein D9C73_014347 [Collichthys lucidus]|uniref:Uncharacterized protein n=1 Tax=Collichthys lucidus TaxID=240159 RepID=A0A4U5UW26_COLLU|nr:hypothetical protein D9C73_014347 [Collichthys lucidus]